MSYYNSYNSYNSYGSYGQGASYSQGGSYGQGGSSGRYNGNPSPFTSAHNVDPAEQGWTYTGCNVGAKVEFYERDGVKMDYYPTTGTVKTAMNHPRQGQTQMFRRGLSDSEFNQVAYNPRQHTGKGYQTKSSKYYK